MQDILEVVRQAASPESLIGALDDNDLSEILAAGVRKSFARGTSVFQQGDAGDFAAFILSGVLKVGAVSPAGREIVFAYLRAGDLIGEISVLDGGPRTASAVAVEAADVLILSRGDLSAVLARNAPLCLKVINYLCGRLRRTDELIESDRGFETEARLARGLLRLLREHGEAVGDAERVGFKISQGDLGAFVMLSRENVNRQLKKWAETGYVDLDRGVIVVRDREALEDIAESAGFE